MAADLSVWLDAIDHALKQPRGPRGTVLTVRSPTVLGESAKFLGSQDPTYDDDGNVIHGGGPLYGLTKRQCRRIRDTIYAAARDDMAGG